jgi:hypothetical protein
LKSSQKKLTERVAELEGVVKSNEEVIEISSKGLEALTKENQKLMADIEYYKPYKARYENALTTTVDKYSAGELLSMGFKKLWELRKLSSIK